MAGSASPVAGTYTDADLLNQIDAEIETVLALGAGEQTLKAMLQRLREKISAQREGRPWWLDESNKENG